MTSVCSGPAQRKSGPDDPRIPGLLSAQSGPDDLDMARPGAPQSGPDATPAP